MERKHAIFSAMMSLGREGDEAQDMHVDVDLRKVVDCGYAGEEPTKGGLPPIELFALKDFTTFNCYEGSHREPGHTE